MINNAIIYSSQMHEGSYRKGTNIPYIAHPFSAMYALRDTGITNETILVAMLLHDLIEDTEATYEDIEGRFGIRVARIVSSVSENKAFSWEERKLHTILDLKTCSYETKLIILADKMNNMLSIFENYREMGHKIWKRFNRGYLDQRWYYSRILDMMAKDHEISQMSLFKEYERLLIDTFGSFESAPVLRVPSDNPGEKNLWYGEGIMSNGILYLCEFWCVDGISNYSYYFGDVFEDDVTDDQVINLLIREGLVQFYSEKRYYKMGTSKDLNGKRFYTMNIVIGDDDSTYANATSLVKTIKY